MVRALLLALALALAAPVTGGAPKKNRHILFVVGDDNGYSASRPQQPCASSAAPLWPAVTRRLPLLR